MTNVFADRNVFYGILAGTGDPGGVEGSERAYKFQISGVRVSPGAYSYVVGIFLAKQLISGNNDRVEGQCGIV